MQPGRSRLPAPRHASFLRVTERGGAGNSVAAPASQITVEENGEEKNPIRPDCYKHFTPRYKTSALDPVHSIITFALKFTNSITDSLTHSFTNFQPLFFQGAVTPPPGQEGLSLKAVIGYNGNGRSNMVWNPDTGELYMYYLNMSCGCGSGDLSISIIVNFELCNPCRIVLTWL